MVDLFNIGLFSVSLIDIIDVVVVAFVFYGTYLLFRDTRASQMLYGMIAIAVLGFLAQMINLRATAWLFDRLVTVWVILFIILFQPELRRILLYIGQNPLLRWLSKNDNSQTEEIITSAFELKRAGLGALLVVLRDSGLKTIIDRGVTINAKVNRDLILSIFNTASPLHDGAIIIYEDQILAAKCILPLSENIELDPTIGTRHLAGLGLSEENDAMVIIVSEETGRISIAHQGKLKRDLNEDELRTSLYTYLSNR
ncbi:MAG: diadenylate cyclase CdaA [Candidatus Neomarinimicrobiota bacterium]|jgi:diadenylate cyclase|nr:diadenylate cyclase CdaA [Candidatus Neomarinimicrobiota bacterium]MDD3965782.1 diadenylate cyclase CdaA [Candidatus Neomarinimicrobiota bacterium]MDX9780654.1 diadenylate cyclase CdaA [bacterium]